jgi:transcriptional regulator with XRE-family HTH domain
MSWPLGRFIANTLQERGGKRAGWSQSRLAELSRLSTTEIAWIVNGEVAGKKGTPKISVDTLIALSKALEIPPATLISVYQGESPKIDQENNLQQTLDGILALLIKSMPDQVLAEALVSVRGAAKIQELLAEEKRRHTSKKETDNNTD